MKYIMGIDLGTSGVKTAIFNELGECLKEVTKEYPIFHPHNGWAEQDPEDWWNATVSSIKEIIKYANFCTDDIVGVGLTGQMHGLVMLDENHNVIRNSIIWCDQRSAKECEELNEKIGRDELVHITANPASTGFTAAKLLWVKNNEPENYQKCKHILLPKDYIRFKLAGTLYSEYSDASGTQFLNIQKRCWSTEILNKLDIPIDWLPKLCESVEITGNITEQVAKLTGLSTNTVTVGGAGDNAAAAVGVGTVKDGRAFTTIGTSGVVYAHSSRYVCDPKCRVHTFCSAVKDEWHIMGVTQAAGLSLKWFRDTLCQDIINEAEAKNIDSYVMIDQLVEKVQIGANKLIFLPYLMGERTPHLDPYCRGTFFGLSTIHTREDMMRAVMEGISYSLRDCYSILQELNTTIDTMTACGGGGKSLLWQQMLADNYQCNVTTMNHSEGAAFGAAILAAVGCGLFKSVTEACDSFLTSKSDIKWDRNHANQYTKMYSMYKNLYKSLKNDFASLCNLDLDA